MSTTTHAPETWPEIDALAEWLAQSMPQNSVQLMCRLPGEEKGPLVGKYPNPEDYFREVLKIEYITEPQRQICQKVNEPPYMVLAPSGHSTGKSYIAAALSNWAYDTFDPGIVLTTAPTERQVVDILWKEIRAQRRRAGLGDFVGPRIPRMETSEKHYAAGYTARDANAFQGHHEAYMLIIFDEAQGIDASFWEAARGMLTGPRWGFLAIYNPIGQGCAVAREEGGTSYHTPIRMSCLDHPNIIAELQGLPAPIPNAVHLSVVRQLLQEWATPIKIEDKGPDDIFFDGQWWQLGPIADARIAGRWPRQAVNSVWSSALFSACCECRLTDAGNIQIGCDVARYGDDYTAIHVRKGFVSLHHESHNGWNTNQITTRCIDLTVEYADKYKSEGIKAKNIPVAIDDTGVGGGVTDQGQKRGHLFVAVNSQWAVEALDDFFDNIRSALWFGVKDQAYAGHLSLARLPLHIRKKLEVQLTTQKYENDTRSRRVVWSKKRMKAETGTNSPDDADGFNLAYLDLEHLREYQTGQIWIPT